MNTGPSYLFDNLVHYVTANRSQLYIGEEGESRTIVVSSNINWTVMSSTAWISTDLSSGSGDAQLNITIDANEENVSRSGTVTISGGMQSVTIDVNQDAGPVNVLESIEKELLLFPNPTDGKIFLTNLPAGNDSLLIELFNLDGKNIFSKKYRIDNNELVIDLDDLVSGTYLLNLKFISQNGAVYPELTRKLVRN